MCGATVGVRRCGIIRIGCAFRYGSTVKCTGGWHDWTMIALGIYRVMEYVRAFAQVVYFFMLTATDKALFSKSRLNMLMVHHT